MPEMDGMEATLRIRDIHSAVLNHNIPIIAMTANAMQGDRERCLEVGMNDYVAKPINSQALGEALNRWLPDEARQKKASEKQPPIDQAQVIEKAVFDRSSFLHRLMDDEDLARMIIAAFLDDIPLQIQELKDSLEADRLTDAERQAHTIKGAAANLGAEALRGIAFEMEKYGKAGDLSAIRDRMSELELQFEALKEVLKKEV